MVTCFTKVVPITRLNRRWRFIMGGYIVDFMIVALLVIGITATNGVLTSAIGLKFFGGKDKSEIVDKSVSLQSGWKSVGGKKK